MSTSTILIATGLITFTIKGLFEKLYNCFTENCGPKSGKKRVKEIEGDLENFNKGP